MSVEYGTDNCEMKTTGAAFNVKGVATYDRKLNFTLQRSEFEATVNFNRWTTSITYGNYAAQPALGFVDRREGILANARYKIDPNWLLLGGLRLAGVGAFSGRLRLTTA